MSVHRTVSGASQPAVTTSLGCVLVTIDDLIALYALLVDLGHDDQAKPIIEFDGGHVDDPEEIRKLTDVELSSLKVKSVGIEVVIASSKAVVVASKSDGEAIFSRWARPRSLPAQWFRSLDSGKGSALFVMGAVGLGAVTAGFIALYRHGNPGAIAAGLVLGTIFIISALAISRAPTEKSYARIIPISLAEYRNNATASKRHWQIATITLAGVVVALIGVIVAILLAK